MTNFNAIMNINTFCASSVYIPTFEDSDTETWFILSKKLREALELPEDAEISDLLSEAAYRTRMPAYARDERDAWHFISERGLYALIFISESPAFQRFRDWAFEVVLPIIDIDGLYIMKEESRWAPPSDHGLEDGFRLEDLMRMVNEVLPEIRATGGYISIERALMMNKAEFQGDNAVAAVGQFLSELKGHRSRKPMQLH
ncbi:BRO family protein [Salipiger bermudensis]|uniref:BRO family protein n=1 Tax=Salipiger bermudensis TaxID=344736 RepID=UPI0035167F8A